MRGRVARGVTVWNASTTGTWKRVDIMATMDENIQTPDFQTAQVQRRLTITDHTLDDINLKKHCPLILNSAIGSTHDPPHVVECRPHSQTEIGLGYLDRLPFELLSDVLLYLDIRSLLGFKQVNHSSAKFVNTITRFSTIKRHCPDILRAAIGIRADSFSLNTLYETLTAHDCATCGRSGNYLYLITCKRVCYFCFTEHADYFPLSSTMAANVTGLSLKQVKKQLPYIHSVPGRYGTGGRSYTSRNLLFDRQAVLKARAVSQDLAVENHQQSHRYNPRRYMSIVIAPYLGPSIDSVDWGFYCHSCSIASRPSTHFRNHYTAKSIIDHIDQHHPGAVLQLVPNRDRIKPWKFLE